MGRNGIINQNVFVFLQKEGWKMKKIISLLLVLAMCLSLCACGSGTSSRRKTDMPDPEEEAVPEVTEPGFEMFPGVDTETGESQVEGRAIAVENVSVGFSEVLPAAIPSVYSKYDADKYEISENQTFAVIRCTITNLTEDTFKLIDTKGDFAVQLDYNDSESYSTCGQTYCHMVSGNGYGSVRKDNSTASAKGMTIAPQASKEVFIYIPCAKSVEENPENPLTVTFICKYSGSESFTFAFDRMPVPDPAETQVVEMPPATEAAEVPTVGEGFVPNHDCWDEFENDFLEIRSVMLNELVNGDMRYTVEFRATEGMGVYVFDWVDGNEYGGTNVDLTWERKTSGEWETFSFDVENAVFHKVDGFLVNFWDEQTEEIGRLWLEKTEAVATQTTGNPVGEQKTVYYNTEGVITVHSLTAQLLDNGCVRYTLDYTASQGQYISFFNPPNGDVFMCISGKKTSGERETYFVDVKIEANNDVGSITMKFYGGDGEGWLWFAPIKF